MVIRNHESGTRRWLFGVKNSRKMSLRVDNMPKPWTVALRIARVNHACQPNACRHLRRNGPRRHPLCSERHSARRRDLHLLLLSFLHFQPHSRLPGSIIPESISMEKELSFFRNGYVFNSWHHLPFRLLLLRSCYPGSSP